MDMLLMMLLGLVVLLGLALILELGLGVVVCNRLRNGNRNLGVSAWLCESERDEREVTEEEGKMVDVCTEMALPVPVFLLILGVFLIVVVIDIIAFTNDFVTHFVAVLACSTSGFGGQ
jgi:uncharacterized protein YqhQ